MKNLLFIILIILFTLSLNCETYYSSEKANIKRFDIVFTVTGDSPFISINYNIYHDLYYGIDYIESYNRRSPDSCLEKNPIPLYYIIQKHTDDNTSILVELEINDILVFSDSTSSPYGYLEISYLITNDF